MSHLNFRMLTFSVNFCHIKIYQSVTLFDRIVEWDFCCDFQTLWYSRMRLFVWFSNIVRLLLLLSFQKPLFFQRINSWHVCNYFVHLVNCKENWGICYKLWRKYLESKFWRSGQRWKLIKCKYSWRNMPILGICNHHPCLHNALQDFCGLAALKL